jgi:hypothetical protein
MGHSLSTGKAFLELRDGFPLAFGHPYLPSSASSARQAPSPTSLGQTTEGKDKG